LALPEPTLRASSNRRTVRTNSGEFLGGYLKYVCRHA
jgi:hypothetical protein